MYERKSWCGSVSSSRWMWKSFAAPPKPNPASTAPTMFPLHPG